MDNGPGSVDGQIGHPRAAFVSIGRPGGPGPCPGQWQTPTTGRRGGLAGLDDPDRLQDRIQLGEVTDHDADNRAPASATTFERMPVSPAATLEPTPVVTVADAAQRWLARGRGMTGPWVQSTRERYERIVRQHVERSVDGMTVAIGTVPLGDLTVDVVAAWSAGNEVALARTTASIALVTLNSILRFAVRRGWLAVNTVGLLEPAERPRWRPGRVAVLEGDDLARVLDHARRYRPLFEVMAFSGLRIGEALGLVWGDVDHEGGILRVHRQLTRYRELGPLKTEAGRREVELAPAVLKLFRDLWLESVEGSGRPRLPERAGSAARPSPRRFVLPGGGPTVRGPAGWSPVAALAPPRVRLAPHRRGS